MFSRTVLRAALHSRKAAFSTLVRATKRQPFAMGLLGSATLFASGVGVGMVMPEPAFAKSNDVQCTPCEMPTPSHVKKVKTVKAKVLQAPAEQRQRAHLEADMDFKGFSKLMASLGVEDEKVARSFFEFFDTNNNGMINTHDVTLKLTSDNILRLSYNVCDLDGNGSVTFGELQEVLQALVKANAYWKRDEFRHATDETFEKMGAVLAEDIFAVADYNHDEVLSFPEYKQFFKTDSASAQALKGVFKTFNSQAVAVML